VRNFFHNPKERLSSDAFNIRVDHSLGSRDFLFGRISQNYGNNYVPTTLPEPANQQGNAKPNGRSWMFSETHTVSSNKVNEFRFGFIFTHIQQDISSPRLFDEYGIKGLSMNQRSRACRSSTSTP
jgi:hypothetical protein